MMKQQTKLVNCGSTVYVYDFKARGMVTKLGFEEHGIQSDITQLKRLLLTNFMDQDYLSLITFKIQLTHISISKIENKLNDFISEIETTTGKTHIKYLALVEFHPDLNASFAYIKLIADLQMEDWEQAIGQDLNNDCAKCVDDYEYENHYIYEVEDYLKLIWKGPLILNEESPYDILDLLVSTYSNSKKSAFSNKYPQILFHNNLDHPRTLRNDRAEVFLKAQSILDYPFHKSEQMHDSKVGVLTINEYSLINTSSDLLEDKDLIF